MILGHGPLGYSLAVLAKRVFRVDLKKKQRRWILLAGFLAGMSPDTDLFYYYPFDISGSHRELFWHTPHFVLLVSALTALLLFVILKKREKWHILFWGVITLGMSSHILIDSLGNGIRWLFPDSRLYGLAMAHPFFDANFFLINFGLEFLVIGFMLAHLGLKVLKKRWARTLLIVLAVLAFVGGESAVLFVNANSFRSSGNTYYGDIDQDGVFNRADEDIDGDGLVNLQDPDSNGNELSNEQDVLMALEDMRGVWYDPLNGSVLNMFTRLGFFLHSDVVHQAYDRAGIYTLSEIYKDAQNSPESYIGSVSEEVDIRQPQNLFAMMERKDLLVPATTAPHLGDVAFMDSGRMVGVVSSVKPEDSEANITMVVPSEEVMEYSTQKVEDSLGPITHWGRFSEGYSYVE